jgi:hypothetical protein
MHHKRTHAIIIFNNTKRELYHKWDRGSPLSIDSWLTLFESEVPIIYPLWRFFTWYLFNIIVVFVIIILKNIFFKKLQIIAIFYLMFQIRVQEKNMV